MVRATVSGRRLKELALAGVSIAAVLLGLGAVEAGIRAFGRPGPDASVDLARLHRFSRTLGWEPRPLARHCEAGHCASINADGYRGPRLDPGSTAPRILMLGDSITFGLDVNDDDTFSDRIHASLGLVTINFAVQGYGPDQSLIRLEEQGLALHPDAVVLNFCLDNDFADTALSTFLFGPQPKPYFELRGGTLVKHDENLRLGPLAATSLWLQERSYLFRDAQDLAARARGSAPLRGSSGRSRSSPTARRVSPPPSRSSSACGRSPRGRGPGSCWWCIPRGPPTVTDRSGWTPSASLRSWRGRGSSACARPTARAGSPGGTSRWTPSGI